MVARSDGKREGAHTTERGESVVDSVIQCCDTFVEGIDEDVCVAIDGPETAFNEAVVDMHTGIDLPMDAATVAINNREATFSAATDGVGHSSVDVSPSSSSHGGPDTVGIISPL